MANKRTIRQSDMRVDVYTLLSEDIDTGIGFALNRAFKYDAAPITGQNIQDRLAESLANEIMTTICGHFDFGDGRN